MNMQMNRYMKSLWALWMLAALVGCSDDLEVFGEYRPCEVIAFTASLDNDVQAVVSRGVASYLDIEEEEWTLEGAGQTNDSRGALVSALKDLNVNKRIIRKILKVVEQLLKSTIKMKFISLKQLIVLNLSILGTNT